LNNLAVEESLSSMLRRRVPTPKKWCEWATGTLGLVEVSAEEIADCRKAAHVSALLQPNLPRAFVCGEVWR